MVAMLLIFSCKKQQQVDIDFLLKLYDQDSVHRVQTLSKLGYRPGGFDLLYQDINYYGAGRLSYQDSNPLIRMVMGDKAIGAAPFVGYASNDKTVSQLLATIENRADIVQIEEGRYQYNGLQIVSGPIAPFGVQCRYVIVMGKLRGSDFGYARGPHELFSKKGAMVPMKLILPPEEAPEKKAGRK
jgi:hypothetical protein